jgi:hypothetical protein
MKMKNKTLLFIQIIFCTLNTPFSQAKEKPILQKSLTFQSVKNGFNYDVKLPEKLYLPSSIGISILVNNLGDKPFRLEANVNDDPWENSTVIVEPGEKKSLQIIIQKQKENEAAIFPAMNGLPGGTMKSTTYDTGIEKIRIKVFSKANVSFNISEIQPFGLFISAQNISEKPGFFPFIDEFGQYKYNDWPAKTNSVSDLSNAIETDLNNNRSMPGPTGRNRFGGWADGPKLKATGNFRTEKVNGKWWLVDPEGCLYWSHGITCIDFTGAQTRISSRSKFFENLPDKNNKLSEFYSVGRRGDTTYNFTQANLYKKYGSQWKERAKDNILKRLKSWGINSFGNWSDPYIYLSNENSIPYTVGVSSSEFPNIFNPDFRNSIKKVLENLDIRIKEDPFCVGFFVDNEQKFNDLTQRLISKSGINKSGLPFLNYLKNNYSTVQKLNKIWGTTYSNWQQVDTITKLPEGAKKDIQYFDLKIINQYYKICREEIKSFAPDKIYLGSRLDFHFFPSDNDQNEIQIIKIASKYCDVVSFNRYRFSTEELILPEGIDKPTLIGEFHWGALDRGLFHVGMRGVADQNQRAETYKNFVNEALNNPQIVGTHWFQYGDQAATGRGDGENYQIGFVDVCDNPYPEIVNAARKIGYQMYIIRYGK